MPLCHHECRPDVSVVIPVFNKLELTRNCIKSILEFGAQASFETIVVDNGSTDDTRQWLTHQAESGPLKAIFNQNNLGFSRGCNVGAEAATGRYILFLNNDMEVTPSWLDPMVTTLDNDPGVGITGARLLFPDRTIQHAGVALLQCNDPDKPKLLGEHVAYKLPASSPMVAIPKYFQIVTGAALMIRQELFSAMNGFDEDYWNGNEDVDLCLRVGEAGWKVVYRPESVIIHYESQSGEERWAKVQDNVLRFNEIWKGRAKADLIVQEDGQVERSIHNHIRTYPERRLQRSAAAKADPDTVSVIVLTWNALEYTKLCAASLLKHTDERHEIIFVDNGSRPDTVEFLQELARDHSQVKVILNGENLGFAAGNNVGIAAAVGRHVCLINSDTVVTAGWLESMIGHLNNNSNIGLVGPLTNSITGAQKLEKVEYNQNTCEGLAEFAHGLTASLAGQCQKTMWVVGFCVLIRDELLERLGGLDESFGQGNYEDTDYCLRTFVAGYACVIAADSFVHHYGSRSFVDGDVDYAAELRAKHAIFRKKWNLPVGEDQNAPLDTAALLNLGFIPALHFHPLPGGNNIPLWDWEKDTWIGRGEAFFKAGRLDEAQRVFRLVLALCPGHGPAANNLACALWQTCDEEKAIPEAVEILEGILARDPDNEDAKWNLQEMRPVLVEG